MWKLKSCQIDRPGFTHLLDCHFAVKRPICRSALPILGGWSAIWKLLQRHRTPEAPLVIYIGGWGAVLRAPRLLTKVHGVGTLTALTFILTLGNKQRFAPSRDVGSYLGLRPRRDQSGERDPQLGITKAGNAYLRSLLVECANHVLGPFGKDSALRRWGLKLAERGGKNAKRKALVAVAPKLAVLLHKLWSSQEEYDPFYRYQAA